MLIQGKHGRPVGVEGPGPSQVDQPNHSFRFLTIDSAGPAPDPNSLLPADQPSQMIKALKDLADQMFEQSDTSTDPSKIPPVYTYWGQFIDHDVTAGTDRESTQTATGFNLLTSDILNAVFTPHPHKTVEAGIVNLRLPELDLDSVYGGEAGPQTFGVPAEGIYAADNLHLRVGENTGGGAPPAGKPSADGKRDLPRRQPGDAGVDVKDFGKPRIGDERNDENLAVAQFHTAFLHFHNQVVDMLAANPTIANHAIFAGLSPFRKARQLVRWTYQWLVVEDYLKTIAKPAIVDEIRYANTHFFTNRERFMPLEYSVAGFRFGHTMVRAAYDYNLNFTMHNPNIGPAPLNALFEFTHGGTLGTPTVGPDPVTGEQRSKLVSVWVIDWERFTDHQSATVERFARKIDTNLALPLQTLVNANLDSSTNPTPNMQAIHKSLARRNLLRSYLLNLPTGQHVAQSLGAPVLKDVVPKDKPAVAKILQDNGLDKRTPLWYYILREAEVDPVDKGDRLGEAGSRLVAGTIIAMLKADPDSYLNKGWTPEHETGVRLSNQQPIKTIMDFFRFAGVA